MWKEQNNLADQKVIVALKKKLRKRLARTSQKLEG